MSTISITVFIHGTLPVQPLLHIPLVQRFFRCPRGITSLANLEDSHSRDFLTTLSSKYPKEFPADHCYTFGWPGDLNHTARKDAAGELYKDLIKLQKEYKLRKVAAYLRLLTHSHGGNVALCLKNAADKYANGTQLIIDELILLACPVQVETADNAKDRLFKKVYSIHSHSDLLQILDPQGVHVFLEYLKNFGLEFTLSNLKELGPLFSERHFPKHCKVIELNVKYPHRELLHIEFLLPKFIDALPMLLNTLKTHTSSQELTHIFTQEAEK